jgi:hypothetical protein
MFNLKTMIKNTQQSFALTRQNFRRRPAMENKLVSDESIISELNRQLAELEPMRRLVGYLGREVWAEVLAVLDHGEVKHPGDEWKTLSPKRHTVAGLNHVILSCDMDPGSEIIFHDPCDIREEESGRYHLAHAIVRYAMALAKVVEEEL